MTAATHMAAGLYITTIIPDPTISLPLAFASHFVLDMVPHNDYLYLYVKNKSKYLHRSPISKGILVLSSILIIWLAFYYTNNPYIALWGAFLGASPDVISSLLKVYGRKDHWFNVFHRSIHSHFDLGECLYNRTRAKNEPYVENALEGSHLIRANYKILKKKTPSWAGWGISIGSELAFLALFVYLTLV